MKRILTLALAAFSLLFALSACGCGGEAADLVFINDSDAAIAAVVVNFEDRGGGAQNADSSPLRRGESFGFEAGKYPVMVAVYETPPEPFLDIEAIKQKELASVVIQKAPSEGERWYITARDGVSGLMLTVSAEWPSGGSEVTEGGGVWFPSGTLLLVLFLVLPLAVLAGLCVVTLNNLAPQRRRGLFALFFTMLGLAAVLFGGAWVLDENGLAWRTWFQEGLSVVLWLIGLVTGIMTVVYSGRWLAERDGMVKRVVTGISVCCLLSAMLVGTVVGGLWAMGPGEQVVTYQGRKMILGKWVWMDTSYELYEYCGPLVRGSGPAVTDFRLIDVEGAVIDW